MNCFIRLQRIFSVGPIGIRISVWVPNAVDLIVSVIVVEVAVVIVVAAGVGGGVVGGRRTQVAGHRTQDVQGMEEWIIIAVFVKCR